MPLSDGYGVLCGTILQQSADTYVAFLNKFTTQSYVTDNQGHPA